MVSEIKQKPLGQYTDKDWRGVAKGFVAVGVVILFFGIYQEDWSVIKIGGMFIGMGIVLGFLMHGIFGNKTIQLRNDFRYKSKDKKSL